MSGDVFSDRPSVDDWPTIALCYRDFICSHIRARDVIPKMQGCIKDHVKEKLMSLSEREENIKAATELLEYLMSEKDKTDNDRRAAWSAFSQALETLYPPIYDVLRGKCDAENLQAQRDLVRFFMEEISRQIDVENLLPLLIQEKLLKDADYETLCAKYRGEGVTHATMYMISHIHRRRTDWYSCFLGILMHRYSELVRHIDPVEYDKKCQQLQAPVSNAEECPMEVCSGSAHVSRPNLYAAAKPGTSGACSSTSATNIPTDGTCSDDDGLPVPQKKMKPSDGRYFESQNTHTAVTDADSSAAVGGNNFSSSNLVASVDTHKSNLGVKNILAGDSGEVLSDVENGSAHDKMDVEEEEVSTPIQLRNYQRELAEEALTGRNVIICAPTGSGKTHVALKIIQDHLLQGKGASVRKVVFLVDKVALANQQYEACEKFLKPFRCKLVCGDVSDAAKVPLNYLMENSDVLVMTAQILLDALDKQEVHDICQFSLLVFDECHHTSGRHPFNCIMHHYMAAKFPPEDEAGDSSRQLPQVIGLTASVGVGKAGSQSAAENHIQKLCAHLDADYISTVHQHIEELKQHTNDPTYEQRVPAERSDDKFRKKIEEIMQIIEGNIENSEYIRDIQDADFKAKLRPPSGRGSDQYTGWLSLLRQNVAKADFLDDKARRSLQSSRCMLEFYNDVLGINNDFDTEDALTYLKKEFQNLNDVMGNRLSETDTALKDLFEKNLPYLERISKDPNNSNPKLIELERILMKTFSSEPASRAIIFVKTKAMATALVDWMLRRPDLKSHNPRRMTGAGSSAEEGGMTKSQQVDAIKGFGEGKHRILVATSVAEEGLDIRECNLVMRYCHISNEIAMVQARGRARAENSAFVTLASQDKRQQYKEEVNMMREVMMGAAIQQLQAAMERNTVQSKKTIENIQIDEKRKRDNEKKQNKARPKDAREAELRCSKCDAFGCMSSQIRRAETKHHLVIDQEFRTRFFEKQHPKPVSYDSMQMRLKMFCKECGNPWGNVNLYKEAKVPVIMINSFVTVDSLGRRTMQKKWNLVPFPIEELTDSEMDEYRRQAFEADYVMDA